MSHPQILEAAVIAVPDEKWTERPLAVVVPKPNEQEINKNDLVNFLAERFPKFWLPNHVSIISSIPRTSVGKFDKKALRKQYAEGKLYYFFLKPQFVDEYLPKQALGKKAPAKIKS